MKTGRLIVTLVALAMIVSLIGPTVGAQPPAEDIEAAIVAGLEWLAGQQNGDGSFGGECDPPARTGLAILKFEDRALDLGYDPLDPEYEYWEVVKDGLDYIVSQALPQAIGPQPAGDPDGDGDGWGVYWNAVCGTYHEMYNTGAAMMALAASGHPELYGDLVQDAVDFLAWAQEDPDCAPHRGGWRYAPNQCSSDNSNSGYVTLGLGYAQAPPPFGFGLTVPQFVKDELSIWIDVIQDDVDGDVNDGGSWYDPNWAAVNILKTGNLIYEMGLVGDDAETGRVQDAVDYIERQWYANDPNWCGGTPMWQDHRQAMFTMMKGFEALGIELIDLDNDNVPEHDWFAEVAQHLLDTQNPDGSWPGDCWAGQILSTAWALLTLEKAVPTFEIPVPLDIHPTSCPNPINTKSKGLTPVAILGFEDFDVTQIDPVTVVLFNAELEDPVMVSPVGWAFEDVATPFEPFLDKPLDIYACTEEGPDGYMDMTLKFDTQELVAAMGEVSDGQALKLTMTGNLLEEFGGTPIVGEDVVKIIHKTK